MDDAEAERLVDQLLSGEPESTPLTEKLSEGDEGLRRAKEAFYQAKREAERRHEKQEKLNESLTWQRLHDRISPL